MTDKQYFEAVASIHIYHRADVCYQKQALKALKNLAEISPFKEIIADHKPLPIKEILDEIDVANAATEEYNRLLEDKVAERFGDSKPSHDYWGAKCFLVGGVKILAGDDTGQYPFYADFDSMLEHISNS